MYHSIAVPKDASDTSAASRQRLPLRERKVEVDSALARVRREYRPDHTFVNVIDLGEARNVLYSNNAATTALVTQRLGVHFDSEGIARPSKLLLRKQITPLL